MGVKSLQDPRLGLFSYPHANLMPPKPSFPRKRESKPPSAYWPDHLIRKTAEIAPKAHHRAAVPIIRLLLISDFEMPVNVHRRDKSHDGGC